MQEPPNSITELNLGYICSIQITSQLKVIDLPLQPHLAEKFFINAIVSICSTPRISIVSPCILQMPSQTPTLELLSSKTNGIHPCIYLF